MGLSEESFNQVPATPSRKLFLKPLSEVPLGSTLKLGGLPAPADMMPGEYLVACEAASVSRSKRDVIINLVFRVTDGKFDSVELKGWFTASKNGAPVARSGRYARTCEVALGRPLEDGDAIGEPEKIFVGQRFVALVGFRKTAKSRGGRFDDSFTKQRKDDSDFLRVHELLKSSL